MIAKKIAFGTLLLQAFWLLMNLTCIFQKFQKKD